MKRCMMIIALLLMIPNLTHASNEWYVDWIDLFRELDYIEQNVAYEPNNTMSKKDFLALVLKFMKYDELSLNQSVELGLISDHQTDIVFNNPEAPITRGEAARVIYNAFLYENDRYSSDIAEAVSHQITDLNDVNVLNRDGVIGCLFEGIFTIYSDGSFKPDREMTQGEIAAVIAKLTLKEKRKQMYLDLPSFSYEGTTPEDSFRVYYNQNNQDIYNVLSIMSEFENNSISKLTPLNTHIAKGVDGDLLTTVVVSKNNQAYPIQITHNRNHVMLNDSVYKLYDYLFSEDAKRIIAKIETYSKEILEKNQSLRYETETLNRKVVMVVDEDTIKLNVTTINDITSLNTDP